MEALLIADLHLQEQRPQITALAHALLDFADRNCRHLYILGDLFEYWLGDDACHALAADFASHLNSLSTNGTQIQVMHGNRDFLLGEQFAALFNGQLIRDDSIVLSIAGTRTLLLHGDTLCTDDTDYQAFRSTVRDSAWQRSFLGKPVAEREAIARQIRHTSKQRGALAHQTDIADINETTLSAAVRHHGVKRVIHGHTHRPMQHIHTIDDQPLERLVLGDWHDDHAVVAVAGERTSCGLKRWDGNALHAVNPARQSAP